MTAAGQRKVFQATLYFFPRYPSECQAILQFTAETSLTKLYSYTFLQQNQITSIITLGCSDRWSYVPQDRHITCLRLIVETGLLRHSLETMS